MFIDVYNVLQSKHANVMITTLILNGGDQVLYSGDNFGFVHCWNVSEYALNKKETNPPERKSLFLFRIFRLHLNHILFLLGTIFNFKRISQ